MDFKNLKKDLDKLDKPLINGNYNLCYGDGYYAKSLVDKYGKSLMELREMVNGDGLERLNEHIEKEETIQEVSYKYNIGFEEMVDFYNIASSSEIKQMEKLVKNNNWNGFKKLIKNVLGINLKG